MPPPRKQARRRRSHTRSSSRLLRYGDLAAEIDEHLRGGWMRTLTDQRLRHFFRQRPIDTETMAAYVFERETQGASASEIYGELWALKEIFDLAVKGQKLATAPRIPFPLLPPPPRRLSPPQKLEELYPALSRVDDARGRQGTKLPPPDERPRKSAKLTDAVWAEHVRRCGLELDASGRLKVSVRRRVQLLLKDQGVPISRWAVARRIQKGSPQNSS
jgi:hypothetical protein